MNSTEELTRTSNPNCPEILQPVIRQYKKTCDDALIPAFHYEKTKAIVSELQQKLEQAEAQVKQCQSSMKSLNERHKNDDAWIEAVENAYLFHTKESIDIVKAAAIREIIESLGDVGFVNGKSEQLILINGLEQHIQSLLDNAKGD